MAPVFVVGKLRIAKYVRSREFVEENPLIEFIAFAERPDF